MPRDRHRRMNRPPETHIYQFDSELLSQRLVLLNRDKGQRGRFDHCVVAAWQPGESEPAGLVYSHSPEDRWAWETAVSWAGLSLPALSFSTNSKTGMTSSPEAWIAAAKGQRRAPWDRAEVIVDGVPRAFLTLAQEGKRALAPLHRNCLVAIVVDDSIRDFSLEVASDEQASRWLTSWDTEGR